MNWRVVIYKFLKPIYTRNIQKLVNKFGFFKNMKDRLLKKSGALMLYEVYIEKDYLETGFKFIAPITIADKAKERGVENTLIRSIKKCLKTEKNDCISIDVGANFGFVSLALLRTISQKGMVYAFEPNRFVFETFKQSILANNLSTQLIAHRKAVGAHAELIRINSGDTTSNILDIPASFLEEVEMITLDAIFLEYPRVDLIKIDVDGLEAFILQGAQKIIEKFRPIIVFEANNEAPYHFFEKYDYKLYDLFLNTLSGYKLGENIFAIPNK